MEYEKIAPEYKVPESYLKEAEYKGSVECLEYDTHAYGEDERALHKKAYVYLPYGYDETKEYPVLYLMHGGGDNEEYWLIKNKETVNVLDHLIEEGKAAAMIVVTPTFYPGDRQPVSFKDNDPESVARRAVEMELPWHFHPQLRKDLIPAVESKYSTYAHKNTSEESLHASRRHRAFAGLSMGSMTTYWSAFNHCLDLFSRFAPMSGCVGPRKDADAAAEELLTTINETFKDEEIDYFFACNGTDDMAHDEHVYIMKKVAEGTDKLVEGRNYRFMDIPGEEHRYSAWLFDLYNAVQIFWNE